MLDNKKTFDVLTPMSDFHRVSRKIKDIDTFEIAKGMWAKQTNEGLVALDDAASGLSVLCLNDSQKADDATSKYEANDTKVGNITAIQQPGLRVVAGASFFVAPDVVVGLDNDVTVGTVVNGSTITAESGVDVTAVVADMEVVYTAGGMTRTSTVVSVALQVITIAHDSGFIVDTAVAKTDIREENWNNTKYNAGVALKTVVATGDDLGKLVNASSGDFANAMIESVDNAKRQITYVLMMGTI